MTSLNAIHLQVLTPVYTITSTSSGSTIHSCNASIDGDGQNTDVDPGDTSDDNDDEEGGRTRPRGEQFHDLEGHGRYLDIPAVHRAPSSGHAALVATTDTHSAPGLGTIQLPATTASSKKTKKRRKVLNLQHPFQRSSSASASSSSVNGIDHALKLNFMSTLGPGIPVTPTVSVFGDGLPGFINRNPSHPGGIFGYSPEEEKKLVRKIDWRIIPILGLFYGASTLDRINLTNARMFAFQNALHATNEQFNWAIAVFFIGYGLAEIPSIIALLYLTPKVWLPASMFVWGCINFGMAWCQTFPLLLALRFLLGIAEAALIPGVLIYIAMFYKKSEQTFRMALLGMFSSCAGAFGGLISGAIGHLDGELHIHGWQWIFILESFPSMALAIAAYFLLTKSPESAPWLDQRETSIAIYRIRNDTKIKVTKQISKKNIVAAMTDTKVYLFMVIHLAMTVPVISSIDVLSRAWMAVAKATKAQPTSVHMNGTFPVSDSPDEPLFIISSQPENLNPTIESLMREPTSAARVLAQLLSSPAYALGAISTFGFAILADRTQQRGFIMVGLAVISIVGYLMVLLTDNVYVTYAGTMVISIGQTPMTPIVTSWLTTNLGGYAKRAVAVAMFLLSSSIAGALGPQLYKSKDGPQYLKGHLLNIGCMLVVISFTLLQRWMLKRENNRRNYSVSFGVNPLKYLSKAELRDLNDKHPAFRYNL
ncbi:hypothetical protein BGZ74_003749 [Mortierella antarctica]|nr:hypothetical protein BGZ74_003749 [Mortierella antarctica]